MDVRIFTEPQQGATYDELLAVAKLSEELGFDGFFRSDHYLKMGDVSGLPGPTDAWITLAGLARETSRIRLGTLVNAATFRPPGPLAITVAQVDQMSGGRVELGLGAGWFAEEHAAYGLPFPEVGERFDRLAEQLAIITGLWATEGGYSFSGHHYQVVDSPGLPKPVQRPVPIIMGGAGAIRTPQLAATYASEFNVPFSPVEFFTMQRDRVLAACASVGRNPETMTWSVAQVVCCGATEKEFIRRAVNIGRDPDELRSNGACGSPGEVRDRIERFAAAGAERVYLQVLDLSDLDHLGLIAEALLT